jgi:hypothetical protein
MLCFYKCEINSIYKVTSVINEEIEEAPLSLEEDRKEIWVESVSSRGDGEDRGETGTPALNISHRLTLYSAKHRNKRSREKSYSSQCIVQQFTQTASLKDRLPR